MVDAELKSKSATGGGLVVGSKSEEFSGVASSLEVLESEDRRIRLEDPEPDEGVRRYGDGELDSDDDETFNVAGDIARCAVPVPSGTCLGRGATFLRNLDFF